jgi:aldose 1-epimerase
MPTLQQTTDRAVPSGAQILIASGDREAVIVAVGGGIRSFQVAGRDVLDGYHVDERCLSARGQPLIPWPNRLHEGRYVWDGQHYQAPINEVAKHNALHGYTRFHNWIVTTVTPNEAVALLRLHPQEGYPFILDLSITYTLDASGLTVTNTARNAGVTACPYAHGAHPYITVGTDTIDAANLKAPGNSYLPTDKFQIPVGREPVDGTPFDFRGSRTIGDVQVDHAFTDLTRDGDGLARVEMASTATGRTVTVWTDEHYPYLMLFTGDTIPDVPRRRRGLGVEPMTCPPNAFATGEDIIRLEPGEAVTTRWGIVVEDR